MIVLAAWLAAAHATPADLTTLERLLTTAHPAPHRYVSASELRAAFATARQRLADVDPETAQGQLAVGREVHALLALLGDAHTFATLPLMQPSSEVPLSILPVLPRTVGDRVLIDASPLDLDPATELLAVDGMPATDWLGGLAPLVPADGRDPVAVRRRLEWDAPKYHALQHGFAAAYTLTLQDPDGTVREVVVPGVEREGMAALRASRHVPTWSGSPTDDNLPWMEEIPTPSGATAAYLRVPTFGVSDVAAFKERVDLFLGAVAPEQPLIVDLRGNEGGLRPNAVAILAHLPGRLPSWEGMRVVRRRIPGPLRKDLQFPYGTDLDRLGPMFKRQDDGSFLALGDPLLGYLPDSERRDDRLRGPLRILVDGRTGSAANGFVLAAEAGLPHAVTVGERVGGGCDRHTGELAVVWTGPESGVLVLFSLIDILHVEVAGCVPGRGLDPDRPVVPTVEDFVSGVDPWLEAALRDL